MPKTKTRPKSKRVVPKKEPGAKDSESKLKHDPTPGLYGWITHTDLASADPSATKAWAEKVIGWKFKTPFPSPNGDVHLFVYSDKGGGAIRKNNPPEIPGSIPYIHVSDCQAMYDKALKAGAEEMMSPTPVMEGVTIAIVRAPGGTPIGFSGP
jgi:predicted enzyme related to lactoylglutathione lyase